MTAEARRILERVAVKMVVSDMQNIYEDTSRVYDEVAKLTDSELIKFTEE